MNKYLFIECHSKTNPIENIFSMLRNNLNRNENETEIELKNSID